MLNNIILFIFYPQQYTWTTWTTWTTSKSVKKNIIFFPDIKEESKLIFIVKTKKYKKNIFIFPDFNVVHPVHPVHKSTLSKKGEL